MSYAWYTYIYKLIYNLADIKYQLKYERIKVYEILIDETHCKSIYIRSYTNISGQL